MADNQNVGDVPVTKRIKDSLLGYTAINQEVGLLDFGNVVIRKDYANMTTVRLISGTSCGLHDLGLADCVGKGMLTASIQGEAFVAPYSKQILQTIRELSLKKQSSNCEILAIVPINSSDCFNFGLAIERAKNDNLRVQLLEITNNNCICLIIKLAGAMAEQGKNMTEIYDYCKMAVNYIQSSKPWNLKDFYCESPKTLFNDLMINNNNNNISTQSSSSSSSSHIVIVLLNTQRNIGKMDEYYLVKKIVDRFKSLEINIVRFYCRNFLSSQLDQSFLSLTVSILSVFDSKLLDYLDSACSAPGWPPINQYTTTTNSTANDCVSPPPPPPSSTTPNQITNQLNTKNRLSPPIRGPILNEAATNCLRTSLQFACSALISCELQLNIIDKERSHGNMGTRVKNAATRITQKIESKKLILNRPFTLFQLLSKLLEKHIGGTMGSIYGLVFEAVANVFGDLPDNELIRPGLWLDALKRATAIVKTCCNIDIGQNTIYDPLKACENAIIEQYVLGCNILKCYTCGVSACELSALSSKRDEWMYPDVGAHIVGIWMRAVYEGVKFSLSECDF